jgi:hypothetical protein
MFAIAAANTYSQINSQIHNFNWHSPSWDLFIFLAWLAVSVIYAFTSGKGRIINILVSVYIAKLLTIQAPFLTNAISGKLPSALASLQQLVVFILLFIILFIFLGRYAFRSSVDSRHMVGSIIFGLIFAIMQIGLLINIILSLLPVGIQNNFSSLIHTIFINNPAGFVWLIAPLIYLILVGKFISDSNEL